MIPLPKPIASLQDTGPRIGVLALQGAFQRHLDCLAACGARAFEVRTLADLNEAEGLVIPGGESTVMSRILEREGLMEPLRARIQAGLPTWGTCAGLILLAGELEPAPAEGGRGGEAHVPGSPSLIGALDVTVRRNAFGRQNESFTTHLAFKGMGEVEATFIRAPLLVRTGESVEVLARIPQGVVAACSESVLVTAFHPELSTDLSTHRFFLERFVLPRREARAS